MAGLGSTESPEPPEPGVESFWSPSGANVKPADGSQATELEDEMHKRHHLVLPYETEES
jgi:hypothetical protein